MFSWLTGLGRAALGCGELMKWSLFLAPRIPDER